MVAMAVYPYMLLLAECSVHVLRCSGLQGLGFRVKDHHCAGFWYWKEDFGTKDYWSHLGRLGFRV